MNLKVSERFKTIFVACCLAINVLGAIAISLIFRFSDGERLVVNSAPIPVAAITGSIQAIALFLCVVSVCVKHKLALKFSYIYFGLAAFNLVYAIIVQHSLSVLPGVFTLVLSIFSVTIMGRQFISIENEKVTDYRTGLPNRAGLNEILEKNISKNKPFDVMTIQIVNLKSISDDIGHKYTEVLLQEAAERLKETLSRRGDVCMLSSNEFCIPMASVGADSIARRAVSCLSKPFYIEVNDIKSTYYLDVRAGIAEFPKDSRDVSELIKFSDIALFHATTDMNNKYRFYNAEMQTEIKDYVDTVRKTKFALDNDYFNLVYQPQFTANGKKLRGFETLIRMNLPDGGNVPPGKFIEIAERTDLIVQIDNYVLRRAMTEFASIYKKTNYNFIVSVNVSAKSMADSSFAENVRNLMTRIGFPPSNLEIEITEYSLSVTDDYTERNIDALKALGVKFALDDFGTGYTSLSKLMSLKVDLLKIDKSLIDNIANTDENRALVDSVIYMGHLMKCEVIAEGVEYDNQLDAIKECKCDLVQGYIWGRPDSFENAVNLVKAQQAG